MNVINRDVCHLPEMDENMTSGELMIYFEYVRIKETQLGRHMHHSVSSLLFHSVCFHRQLYLSRGTTSRTRNTTIRKLYIWCQKRDETLPD